MFKTAPSCVKIISQTEHLSASQVMQYLTKQKIPKCCCYLFRLFAKPNNTMKFVEKYKKNYLKRFQERYRL